MTVRTLSILSSRSTIGRAVSRYNGWRVQTKARDRPPVRRQSITKLLESGGFDWTVGGGGGGQFIRLIAERKRFHRRRMMEPARRKRAPYVRKWPGVGVRTSAPASKMEGNVCVARENGGEEREVGKGEGGHTHAGYAISKPAVDRDSVPRVLCRYARPRPLQFSGIRQTSVSSQRDRRPYSPPSSVHNFRGALSRRDERTEKRNNATVVLWSSAIALC